MAAVVVVESEDLLAPCRGVAVMLITWMSAPMRRQARNVSSAVGERWASSSTIRLSLPARPAQIGQERELEP